MFTEFSALPLIVRVLVIAQSLGVCFLIYEAVRFSLFQESPLQSRSMLMTIFAAIYVIGCTLELLATSSSQALNAARIEFIGHPMAMYCLFCVVSSYCRVSPSRLMRVFLMSVSILSGIFMLSSDVSIFMLRDSSFITDGIPHLLISYGPLYFLYIALMAFYLAAMASMIAMRYFRSRQRNKHDNRLLAVAVMALLPPAAFLLCVAGAFGGYDTSSFAFILSTILLHILFTRFHIFDSLSVALDQALNDAERGIILLDDRGEICFTNQQAHALLNELPVMRDMVGTLLEHSESKTELMCGKEVYSVKATPIADRCGVCGTSIVLRNITGYYQYTNDLLNDMEKQTAMVRHVQANALLGLAGLVEARDRLTGTHIKRTSDFVRLISTELRNRGYHAEELTDDQIDIFIGAAPLHDIGKLAIPDSILKKPSALTPQETEVMRTHTTIGATLIEQNLEGIESTEFIETAMDLARSHHEKWNGTGYPNGLSGEEIPLSARIMSLADVYDALTSDRCYRSAMPHEQALIIMREGSGTFFDPTVFNAFLACAEEMRQCTEKDES